MIEEYSRKEECFSDGPMEMIRRPRRAKTQPSQLIYNNLREGNRYNEETKAQDELRRRRTEIKECEATESEGSKEENKEIEVINMIKGLQSEMNELTLMINSAHEKLKNKDEENRMLKENIEKIKGIYESTQTPVCKCQVF